MSTNYINILKTSELFYNLNKIAMIVNDTSGGLPTALVVAHGANIWLFEPSIHYAEKFSDLSQLDNNNLKDMISKLNINKLRKLKSPSEIISTITDESPHIFVGVFNKKNKSLFIDSTTSFRLSPTTSVLVRKVAKALDVFKVEYSDNSTEEMVENITHHHTELSGSIPRSLYHGTSLSSAVKIINLGLSPKPSLTNYKEVIHEDHVFLTSLIDEAKHHADVASRKRKENNENKGVVFLFKIPDPARLISDYDVDVESEEAVFSRPSSHRRKKSLPEEKDSFKLSREFGLFGYEGRIPASFIERIIFIDLDGTDHEINKNELIKIYEMGGDYNSLFYSDEDEDEEY